MSAADAKARGEQAAQAGRIPEAIVAFREALAARPDDLQVRAWLGQCLGSAGYLHQATVVLREGADTLLAATSPKPDDALGMAQLLQRFDAPAEALALADAVFDSGHGSAPACYLAATCAAQLGQLDRAHAAASEALRLTGGGAAIAVLLASIECDAGNGEAALARLDRLLADDLPPREAFRAHKERARAADQVGRFAEVFPGLAAAARFAPRLPEYASLDRGLIGRLVAADKAAFTPAMLRRWQEDGPADNGPAPIFLTGLLRSGTTMMQEILATDPATFVADEAPLLAGTLAAFNRQFPGPEPRVARLDRLSRQDRAGLRGYYRKLAMARYGPTLADKRLVDKFTLNLIDLPLILRLFPESPILFMARDPRDCCLSATLQLMPPSPATVNLLDWQDGARFHADIAECWLRPRDWPGFPGTALSYEGVVADIAGTLGQVLPALGLEWRPEMRDFHRHAAARHVSTPSRNQVTRPLNQPAVARWRNYPEQFAAVADVLNPAVAAYGYQPG